MPVLLRPVNNFLGQVIGNASTGKYNTVNNTSSGEVTFQKCLKSGIQGDVHKVTYNMGQFKQYNSIAIKPKIN